MSKPRRSLNSKRWRDDPRAYCVQRNDLQRRVVRSWCVGGPAWPISEIAFAESMTVEALRAALSHIPDLNYVTARLAALTILFETGSSEGRALGLLVDGDPFEILDLDAQEALRLAIERDYLLGWHM